MISDLELNDCTSLHRTVSHIVNRGDFPYSYRAVPVWRNWQTRGTQNPVRGDSGVGSIPSTGTSYFPGMSAIYDEP